MPPYYDVYALSRDRSAKAVNRFLNAFATQREESAVEYEFPQCSEQPRVIFESAQDVIMHCEAHPSESQSLYFRNLGDGPAHVMLFFTSDGAVILGLSVDEGEAEWFARLKAHVGSNDGYITFETAPPATMGEFLEMAAIVAEDRGT